MLKDQEFSCLTFERENKFTVRITMTRKEGGKEKKACRSYSELLVLPRADCFGGTGGALLSEPKLLLEITESLERSSFQPCRLLLVINNLLLWMLW